MQTPVTGVRHAVVLRGQPFSLAADVGADETLALRLLTLPGTDADAREWTGVFSAQYVEQVAQKTGNFKRFKVFVEMLASALVAASATTATTSHHHHNHNHYNTSNMTLSLDLISHADLNATPSSLHQDDSPVTAHDRVYLILTYAAAYDRVHYPLPLQLVPPKRIQSTRRPQSPSIHIPHVPDISNTQDTATDTHASLVQEIASLQSHIHYLEQENKTHLNEISRLLRENDKLRHAVKHAHPSKTKQTSNRPLDGIRSDEMPHLFQALFQGLGTMISSPSSSSSRETFKKSLKALKRLVFRLLDEVGPPERVQDILEASAIPKSGNRPHSSSQRRSQAAKQKSSPVPNSSRYKSPAGSGYRPVKSQPLGLNTSLNSSSPAVLGSSSTRRKPVDSPRYTPNPPTRSNSATKLRSASSSTPFRRFDPTSYVIEKELKQLAARAQSQERLARARSLSAKRPSTAAVHSRTASLASSGISQETGRSTGSRGSYLGEHLKSRAAVVGKHGAGGKMGSGGAGSGGRKNDVWKVQRENEEDIDRRLEFLQQYLNTLNK